MLPEKQCVTAYLDVNLLSLLQAWGDKNRLTMVIKYNDPYGNRKYAQLKGEKHDAFFKIVFSEAVIHKTDEAYILFGQVDEYQGIVRSFKPENPIAPGLCIVPIYGQEYEVRKKDKDGNWSSSKVQPSLFEATLYELIKNNEDDWMPHNASIKGQITHVPDTMLASQDKASRESFVSNNVEIEQIDSTGKIPDYTPSTTGGQRKSYGGYQKVTMEDKLVFIKKELVDSIESNTISVDDSLGKLVHVFNDEHDDDENYQQLYFDLLMSIVR